MIFQTWPNIVNRNITASPKHKIKPVELEVDRLTKKPNFREFNSFKQHTPRKWPCFIILFNYS